VSSASDIEFRSEGLMNLEDLHPLVAGVADEPWARQDYAGAVEAAWFALRDELRNKLDSTADGAQLVNEISERDPKLLLTDYVSQSDRSMHKGVLSMLRGVALYVRNPMAHDGDGPPGGNDPARCFEYLAIMSLCARHVVTAIHPTTVEEIVRQASQRRFAATPEATTDLISTLPPAHRPALVVALASAVEAASSDPHSVRAANLLAVYRNALDGLPTTAPAVRRAARNCARLLADDSTFNVGVDLLTLGVFEALEPRHRAQVVNALLLDTQAGEAADGRLADGGRFSDSLILVFAGLKPRDRALILGILTRSLMAVDKRTAFALRLLAPLSHLLTPNEYPNPASGFADAVLGCERGDDIYGEASQCSSACSPSFARTLWVELHNSFQPAGTRPEETGARDPAVVRRILALLQWNGNEGVEP
jgi:hypothetical protein